MPWRRGNKLKLVREPQAEGKIRDIYEDIKRSLGVPHVNVMFQAYAVYPRFLERHWTAMKPLVETQEFFDIADRLGAEAYTRAHNYFVIPDLDERLAQLSVSEAAREELARTAELFHYNNPPLLVVAAAQMQAFETPVGRGSEGHRPADHPVFTEKPITIEEDDAPTAVRNVYEDMRRVLGLPFVNTDYRAFARYPDFLCSYWEVLKPILQSPVYSESQQGMRESAWQVTRELPGRTELTASELIDDGMSDDEVSAVVRITDLFLRALSGLVLNVAVAKIGLEGGNRQKDRPRAA